MTLQHRNPDWERVELILALDLYFRKNPSSISDSDPEIIELSNLLKKLPIHENVVDPDSFRNPNSVYMKLCNFLVLDPAYKGVGLTKGGKKDQIIWDEFIEDRENLNKLANDIKKLIIEGNSEKIIQINKKSKYPIKAYSWEWVSDNKAIKRLDRSAILYNGSGIPKQLFDFFNIQDFKEILSNEEIVPIILIVNNQEYEGKMAKERPPGNSIYIYWKSDLAKIIQNNFSFWSEYLQKTKEKHAKAPQMIFYKTDKNNVFSLQFSENIILRFFPLIEDFHYVIRATTPDFWVGVYQSRFEELQQKYQDNFNLIIFNLSENVPQFYSIPFQFLKKYFDVNQLVSEKGRWIIHIENDNMRINSGQNSISVDVSEFKENNTNISQFSDTSLLYSPKIIRPGLKIEEINFPELYEKVEENKIKDEKLEKIKNPEKITINEIIKNCSKGKWVLPQFQRYFTWKQDDIQNFLDAVFRNHYIGSFLLWNVGKETPIGIQWIKGLITNKEQPSESIILDGQQRITSLLYAIYSPKTEYFYDLRQWENTNIVKVHPLFFYINFGEFLKNPISNEIIYVSSKKLDDETCFNYFLFPFYEFDNIFEWISNFEGHLRETTNDHNKSFIIKNIIHKKLDFIWDKYEIPYITLDSSKSLDQVTDIFLGVNTKGIPLGVFDLLIAKFFKNNIDFKQLWEKTLANYPSIKIYSDVYKKDNKLPVYILQAISLYYDKNSSAKRADVLDIYNNLFENSNLDFEEEWFKFSNYVNNAIDRLENLKESGFGVRTAKEIPYAPTIPIIAALLKVIEDCPNKMQCNKKLAKWYWSSIFTVSYSSAVESTLSSDFKEMKKWFKDDQKIPKSVNNLIKEIDSIDFKPIATDSNTIYRGVMSLIAKEGAKDFDTGLTLEIARKNDKDHIFPKSNKDFKLNKYINSVLNMTWNSSETNQRIKKAKSPSVYINQLITEKYEGNEEEFEKILSSHLIDSIAYKFLQNNNFEGFIQARENLIRNKIKDILEIPPTIRKNKSLISPETPYSNKLIIINKLKVCDDYIVWIDKYFSKVGLDILIESVETERIKEIKILTSLKNLNEKFREEFKLFQRELKNKGIYAELRVIIDNKIFKSFHDRWIISKNINYNIPSPDIIARGQYSEIKETENRPPFEMWWDTSKDIINDWNEIKKAIEEKIF